MENNDVLVEEAVEETAVENENIEAVDTEIVPNETDYSDNNGATLGDVRGAAAIGAAVGTVIVLGAAYGVKKLWKFGKKIFSEIEEKVKKNVDARFPKKSNTDTTTEESTKEPEEQ